MEDIDYAIVIEIDWAYCTLQGVWVGICICRCTVQTQLQGSVLKKAGVIFMKIYKAEVHEGVRYIWGNIL